MFGSYNYLYTFALLFILLGVALCQYPILNKRHEFIKITKLINFSYEEDF